MRYLRRPKTWRQRANEWLGDQFIARLDGAKLAAVWSVVALAVFAGCTSPTPPPQRPSAPARGF